MILEAAARDYRQKGWGIVFIKPGEKRPRHRGWTLKSQEPSDYQEGSQLSILTGALSGDLICVDCDSDKARELAPLFLPKTPLVDGRPGKPNGHYWYRVTNVTPELQAKPEVAGGVGGMRTRHFTGAGIDLLGTGAQAVAPPSLHPSGERREWVDPSAEPATVDAAELLRAVEALAIECGWKDRRREASRYISKVYAVEGASGDAQTFRAASALVCGFALDPAEAWPILEQWNKTNAIPPWTPADLERKLASAAERAGTDPRYPIGHLIRDGRSFDDPVLLAQRFPGIWRCWNNRFFHYADGKYEHITDGEVSARVLQHVDSEFGKQHVREMRAWEQKEPRDEKKKPKRHKVTAATVRDTISALQLRFLVPSKYEMPCLLPTGEKRDWIALRNGILDLSTLELLPHNADWFSTVRLDYDFAPTAQEPRLDGWLTDWFGDDPELAALAQEWAGYCLSRCTDEQSFLVCIGDGANGKSAFAAMLQAIIGVENCSFQGWNGIGERFGLAPMMGKLLNVSDEAAEFSRQTENTLKRYTGGSALTIEEKNQPAFTMQPTARLLACCNEFPRVVDRSDGFWRRMLLLPFNQKIAPDRRVAGMDRASWWTEKTNLSALLGWGLAGLKRLREQGRFTQPRASVSGSAGLRREANPARMFLEECFDPNGEIQAPELYSQYRQWAVSSGLLPLSAIAFGREVARAYPDAGNVVKKVQGKCVKVWRFMPRFDLPSMPWDSWQCPTVGPALFADEEWPDHYAEVA